MQLYLSEEISHVDGFVQRCKIHIINALEILPAYNRESTTN